MGQISLIGGIYSKYTIFLEEELQVNLNEYKCPHLRHLKSFNFQNNQLNYEIEPILTNLVPINNKIIHASQYQDILTQLILGVFELHSNGMIGRCFNANNIVYENNKVIFCKFGYYHSLSETNSRSLLTPESLYCQISTFESDYWLIAQAMKQIIEKSHDIYNLNRIESNQSDEEKLQQDIVNFTIQDPSITIENQSDLKLLLLQMLRVYVGNRMKITAILGNTQLSLSLAKKQQMINYYSNFQNNFEAILKQFINSENRDSDSGKIYHYQIQDVSIWKYFNFTIMEIKLLNLAFHLSFHLPFDENWQKKFQYLYLYVLQRLFFSSKQLKEQVLKLSHNNPQQKQSVLLSNDYISFKESIILAHNNLAQKKGKIINFTNEVTVTQDQIEELFKIITNKFIKSYPQLTCSQQLLIKILLHLTMPIQERREYFRTYVETTQNASIQESMRIYLVRLLNS